MEVLDLFLGLILRLGIPVLITVGMIVLLRKLDHRWQSESETIPVTMVRNSGCWDINHCSEENKKNCAAYAHQEQPCWQYYRKSSGNMQEKCLGCQVFKTAPMPAGD